MIGSAPTGAWTGHADAIAGWTAGGWRFVVPIEGMAVWSRADSIAARYGQGQWSRGIVTASRVLVNGIPVVGLQQPAIVTATGGTTVDAEARATLAAILAALRTHGLIAA